MPPEKLIYMANQIAKFFAHQSKAAAVAAIADHLAKFWDPRMRTQIIELAATEEGTGLDPLALAAVQDLAKPKQ